MMQRLHILNTKEKKTFLEKVRGQWGSTFDASLVFMKSERGKYYLMHPDVSSVSLECLRINNMGVYVAEERNGFFRLSIEGSQLIGSSSTQNVIDISSEEAGRWLMGEDLEKESDAKGFVLIRCGKDFYGCGKPSQGKILNYVGKNRRVSAVHL